MSDATIRVVRHKLTLRYNRRAFLTHDKVQDLQLYHDGRPLVEGVDYKTDRGKGMVFPLVDVPNFTAEAVFRAACTRYDLLCFNPRTRDIKLVRGPERGFDVVDHMPSPPPGYTRLEVIHVGNDIERPEISEPQDLRWVDACRARLPHFMRLLQAGEPVRLMGYGTSLTAQGGPTPPEGLKPNGPNRDCLKFYYASSRLGPDTIARIAVVDDHVRIGFNWFLKAAIERHSPATYLNMGVSGTSIRDGESWKGFPHGNNVERLAAARDLDADLAVLEYCINDIDNPELESGLANMIEALQGPRTDIIVLGCPAFPDTYRDLECWERTEESARRAADATGAAFVPLAPAIRHAGLARRTLCSANGVNHPGPAEMAIYGRWLAKIVPVETRPQGKPPSAV